MILDSKTILVTGGTGSMGKVLVRRILSGELGIPKKVIVFSRDEGKQHAMRLSYLHKTTSTDEVIYRNFQNILEFRIGDVRDYSDVCRALRGTDIVINAAALKQVPICEYFPEQAVLTNCMGANNIVRAIHEHKLPIETVVGISTDKACKPVNVMGMSKAIQERIFIAANIFAKETRFICVRYGNVLASRGSVIPVFHDQIKNNKPLTITDSKMTRFLLSINEAVDTVFEALRHAKPGETYIPRVPSATIYNIAKALIGDRNLEIMITGVRPGEKVDEILVSEEECHHTIQRGDYYVICAMLPELQDSALLKSLPLAKEYSSGNDVLDYAGTVQLLRKHDLLQINASNQFDSELLV